MAATPRDLVVGTLRVDRSRLTLWSALRAGLVFAVLVTWALRSGHDELAFPLALGLLFVAIADSGEDVGRRWRTMLWTIGWLCMATLLGDVGSGQVMVGLILAAGFSLAAGLAGALGIRAGLIGTLSLVMYIVFDGAPATVRTTAEDVAAVAVGGLMMMLVTVLPHAFDRRLWHAPSVTPTPMRERLRGLMNFDDDFVRHAIRLAVVIGATTLFADLTTFPHEYWLPMTVAWITKPDRDGTVNHIAGRITGTIIGVLIAALLADVLHVGTAGIAIAAGVGAAVAVGFIFANYAIAVTGVTMLVVGLLSYDGDPIGETIEYRLSMTLIAGLIAYLVVRIWSPKARS